MHAETEFLEYKAALIEESKAFFRLILRGRKIMQNLLVALDGWNEATLKQRLEMVKAAKFFENQIDVVKQAGGHMLLAFQRDQRRIDAEEQAVRMFNEDLQGFLSLATEVREKVETIKREEQEKFASFSARHDIVERLNAAHEKGKRELDEGLGELYDRESFWRNNIA